MSIEKFTTEALVIASYESGESDVVCKIYTRDFGVIMAKQSSLKKSSKLRQHISLHRFVNVTLVKGKDVYRIVGARESETNLFLNKNNIKKSSDTNISPHISQMVNRFLSFEAKNVKMYDRFISYIKKDNLDMAIIRLCMLTDIMISGGYMDTDSIDMSLDDYKNSSIDDLYMKIVLDKNKIVKNLRVSIDSSML